MIRLLIELLAFLVYYDGFMNDAGDNLLHRDRLFVEHPTSRV